MSSYTNRKGENIHVNEEHIIIAIKIKEELQKSNQSRRCNWSLHKNLMEKQNFHNSDSNESYRCMIKNEQKKRGCLPRIEQRVNMISDSKLECIKDAVGELFYEKRCIQIEKQGLGKLKRDLSLFGVVAEQVKEAFERSLDTDIKILDIYPRLEMKGRMVVFVSDLHVGSVVVNVNGNNYNFDIANKRMKKYLNEIIELAVQNNVTTIDVVCLGDITEGISMRKVSQAFEAEFNMSEQMVKAFEILRDFLTNLAFYFNVTYRGITGNHDRLIGNKEENVDGDSTMFVVNYMIKLFIDAYGADRLEYIESDNINHSTILDVNGVLIKCVHGDCEKRAIGKLASHSAQDGVVYNVLATGHVHHFGVVEVGLRQFEAHFGSLKGMDNYAKKGKFMSGASQGIIIVDENGDFEIRRVDLQNV